MIKKNFSILNSTSSKNFSKPFYSLLFPVLIVLLGLSFFTSCSILDYLNSSDDTSDTTNSTQEDDTNSVEPLSPPDPITIKNDGTQIRFGNVKNYLSIGSNSLYNDSSYTNLEISDYSNYSDLIDAFDDEEVDLILVDSLSAINYFNDKSRKVDFQFIDIAAENNYYFMTLPPESEEGQEVEFNPTFDSNSKICLAGDPNISSIATFLIQRISQVQNIDPQLDFQSDIQNCIYQMNDGAIDWFLIDSSRVVNASQQNPNFVAYSLYGWFNDLESGVIIANQEYIKKNPQQLQYFLESFRYSTQWTQYSPTYASQEISNLQFISNREEAKFTIYYGGLVSITNQELSSKLVNFYQALYNFDPNLIGGKVPDLSDYYIFESDDED